MVTGKGQDEMKDLKDKFKRAGGAQILRQYLQSHVLGYALMQAALQGTSQKSLEIVRLSVNNKMLGKLRRRRNRWRSCGSASTTRCSESSERRTGPI